MSQYDIKMTEYPNGDIEMKIYSAPIFELTEREKERRNKKRLESISRRVYETECDAENLAEYYETLGDNFIATSIDDNGFTSLITKDEYMARCDEIRKRKNARDSYRRTLNAIHDLVRCEKWTMFYTLTFSPEVVDRTCFESCMKKASKWFNNLYRKAPNLKYMFVPELHADGVSWHIHGLVCNDVGVDYVDSGKRDKKGRVIYNVGNWKYGFSTATEISDTHKVSSYILKYITKDLCENSLGKKRYYHSRNIQQPIVSTVCSVSDFDLSLDATRTIDFLDSFLTSFGVDDVSRIEDVSTVHCSVIYINAHKVEKEIENEEKSAN